MSQARGNNDRLLPTLLERLTDHAPQRQNEATQDKLISKAAYRESVLRDLTWLLNTVNAESHTDFFNADHARRSVVNFGVEALSGRQLADRDWKDVETNLHRAITTFEPRILPKSLRIRVLPQMKEQATHNRVSLEIKGQLWCEPYPLELLLHTHVDLECGQVALENRSGT